MAKILIQETHSSYWFERLSAISYYTETEFETRLINSSSSLFANYYVVPFKKTIALATNSEDTTTPDLVFIKKDYSSWILVEVELKGHPLDHVTGQVKVMLKPSYNKTDIIEYIIKQNGHVLDPPNFVFDKQKLTDLISNFKAEVMVIVDETKEAWSEPFRKLKVHLCVVQMYKNADTEVILRIKGRFPQIHTGAVYCRLAKRDIPNGIEIINDHELLNDLNTDDQIEIYVNDRLTRWTAMRTKAKKLYLKCAGPIFPLEPKRDFVIKFDESKQVYLFEKN